MAAASNGNTGISQDRPARRRKISILSVRQYEVTSHLQQRGFTRILE